MSQSIPPPPPLPPPSAPQLPPPGAQPPVPRSGCRKWATGLGIGCAVLVGLLFVAASLLGLAIESGHLPDSVAQPAGKIPAPILSKLRELEIIEPGERVLYFYSAGLLSIEEDGNLFTESRVISYQLMEEELELAQATWSEIAEIEFEAAESGWDDSTITVHRTDGDRFVLWVSAMEGRDHDFHEKLVKTWESGRTPETAED